MRPDEPYQFQHQSGAWPTLVRRLPVLMAAKMALEDKPGVNGEAQPTASPLDFTPWTELAGAGASGAGALLGDEAGALKLPWRNLQEVTSGANPLTMSKENWGKTIQNLGPSVRDKNAQTIGAQLMDEFGSSDPATLVRQRLSRMGVPAEAHPSVVTQPMDSGLAGYYAPNNNGIFINSNEAAKNVQHPSADFLGTVGHEAQHAADAYLHPNFASTREMMPQRPFTNDRLYSQGLFHPKRVAEYLSAAKEDGGLPLPDFLRSALAKGYNPKELAQYFSENDQLHSSMSEAYRHMVGNRGFRGMDPALADTLHTTGHFAPPISGEMDLAPHHMAVAEAQAGATEDNIHPDWISQRLRQAFADAKAPQVQVPAMPPRPIPQAASPYEAAASLGAGAAMGAGHQISKLKADPYNQQTPNPEPNGDEFMNATRKLREWLASQKQSP